MEAAMQLAQLNVLMQQAVRLIQGLNIRQDQRQFVLEVVSVISWFKIVETYTLDGRKSSCLRRDLRLGTMQGSMAAGPSPGDLRLDMQWGDPVQGSGTDVFSMPEPDTLHVSSVIHIGGKKASYRTVYKRQK